MLTAPNTNPFATRYVSPGELPWLGGDEQSLEQLVDRFTGPMRWRAAIVGVHGTGKSTLLMHLIERVGRVTFHETPGPSNPLSQAITTEAENASDELRRPTVWLSLRRNNSPIWRVWNSRKYWRRGGLLVIDGFEQLRRASQLLAMWATRAQGMGLLVTSHGPVGLGTLLETQATLALARKVVAQIFANQGRAVPAEFADERLLQDLLEEEGGNLREVLMRLYDIAASDLPS